MFSGIIRQHAVVEDVKNDGVGRRFTISVPMIEHYDLKNGGSVALNGICFTVVKKGMRSFEVEAMPQTLRVTTVAHWKKGDVLNFEPSLKLGDEISGHFVYGHVDDVGIVKQCLYEGTATVMVIQVPDVLSRMIVARCSVAVDGVSLTVIDRQENTFRMSLLPETLKETTLGKRKAGDKLNIEIDMLARYAYELLQNSER